MIKKHLDLIVVAILVLSLVMYDVTMDLFFSLLHFIFELCHMAYEWLELGIEHTVEHLFHTSRHGSQIVTFYILLLLAVMVIHWLWRVLPGFYQGAKQFALLAWKRRKTEMELYWLSLTLSNKVMLVVTALSVAYLASFFVM
ncbi:hypothetical protein IVG45_20140 [Methylomonas sp. LL1]|uniref:hypothetical protein n=1 Tax=Methylomonas sp. LL1 TaxID=2785785 RepID=UPI0018C3B4B6|nr:hypothetical protein [Methylomonas sp. LL1]QPK63088.1 hypothetical protein IVG45_20140 [Methylomonas sp. LL1]